MHNKRPTAWTIDLFCRVVDNYGDIGVCWRLARQLAAAPHYCTVRLWVDNLDTFQRLEPRVNTRLEQQLCAGITVIHWTANPPTLTPHHIVVEAFACDPPADFVDAMAASNSVWINLEYLSAEPWVDAFHGQPSVQPGGITKYFFFPGFTAQTGGLLREHDLVQRRKAWASSGGQQRAFWQSLGIPSADVEAVDRGTARLVSLFCYPDAPIRSLFDSLAAAPEPTIVMVPDGVQLSTRHEHTSRLRVRRIPFVKQTDFDHLLWSCDINIVRGEDSLVRALWAARPMIWQPYIQDDNAHLVKLDAWLQRSGLDTDTRTLIRSWSTYDSAVFASLLSQHIQPTRLARWQHQAARWTNDLAHHTDLASSLLQFCATHHRTG